MTKESNNAEAAATNDNAADNPDDPTPKGSEVEGSLAPHALPGDDELAPEDLAVLPGHGRGSSSKRLLPAVAVLALFALGVYSLTSGEGPQNQDEQPQAAVRPTQDGPPATPTKTASKPEAGEPGATPEVEPSAPRGGLPMMMLPPAEETTEETPDLGPYGPSVGRFPDLPPSVISYLKKVEGDAMGNSEALGKSDANAKSSEPPAPSDEPAASP